MDPVSLRQCPISPPSTSRTSSSGSGEDRPVGCPANWAAYGRSLVQCDSKARILAFRSAKIRPTRVPPRPNPSLIRPVKDQAGDLLAVEGRVAEQDLVGLGTLEV